MENKNDVKNMVLRDPMTGYLGHFKNSTFLDQGHNLVSTSDEIIPVPTQKKEEKKEEEVKDQFQGGPTTGQLLAKELLSI